jgi:aminopeptidase-like protein
LENNKKYLNQNPKCEPQLGKRGLYHKIGGRDDSRALQLAMLWVLNLSDGNHTLLDISNRSGLEFDLIKAAADILVEHNLLKQLDE